MCYIWFFSIVGLCVNGYDIAAIVVTSLIGLHYVLEDIHREINQNKFYNEYIWFISMMERENENKS